VSAATAEPGWTAAQLPTAEAAMRAMAQTPMFMIRTAANAAASAAAAPDDAGLDALLARRGYARVDPVLGYAIACDALPAPPWMTTFPHWPPMAVARELWAAAGIGPARLAVMQRATGAKTAILARAGDRIAGVAFVAMSAGPMSGPMAMLHALEVAPHLRRQGAGHHILAAAAAWAAAQGGADLTLVVTEANTAAQALYQKCGFRCVGGYHYRLLPDDGQVTCV
jgi:ribosomal protein S18 acetylase RimI-like enzyme